MSANYASKSTISGDELKLPNCVKKVITVMFGRLERLHGEPLARRALGYLTAARNGIMESEMQDLVRHFRSLNLK